MKTIDFYSRNIKLIREGKKTQTRRTRYYELYPGDIVQVESDPTLKLLITRISAGKLRHISEEDGIKEGFSGREEFLKGEWAKEQLEKLGDTKVWVYDFVIIRDKPGLDE